MLAQLQVAVARRMETEAKPNERGREKV